MARRKVALIIQRNWSVLAGVIAVSVGGALGVAIAALHDLTVVALVMILGSLAVVAVMVAAPTLRSDGDALSPLTLAVLFYLLAYIVGTVFYYVQAATQVPAINPVTGAAPRLATLSSPEAVTKAAGLALLGFIALVVGYRLRLLRALLAIVPSFPKAPETVAGVAVPLFIVGWLARAAGAVTGSYFHVIPTGEVVSTGSSWLIHAVGQLPLLATCYVGAAGWLAPAESAKSARLRKLFVGLIALELAWAFPTGTRGQVVATVLALVAVLYYGRDRRLPWRLLATLLFTLVLVVMPMGLFYRGDNRSFQRAPTEAFETAVGGYVAQEPHEFLANTASVTLSRLSDVGSLAAIMEQGRSVSRRSSGETLSWVFTAAIPRFVIPDKPDPGTYGNEFGRTFGIIAPGDLITSIAVTQVGDLFLNFGTMGVLLGMPLVGAAYRLVDDYLRDRTTDPLALATYAAFVWTIIASHETIVAQGLMGGLRLLAVFAVVLWLTTSLARRRRA